MGTLYYYRGGMLMPGRGDSGGGESYRFGFNCTENNDEIKGVWC